MTRKERARRERVAEALWKELASGFDVYLVIAGAGCSLDRAWTTAWARLRRKRHAEYREIRQRWLRAAEIVLRAADREGK